MNTAVQEKKRSDTYHDAKDLEAQNLMLRYKKTRDIQLRNQLVMHYSYIARTVAVQTYGLSSNYAQVEDIVNEGILAIISCIEKYDPQKGATFKVYAFRRVQGAVIDFVRKQDWFPRRVRSNARNIMAAHDQLCNELMREPTEEEISQRLGVSVEEYRKTNHEAANSLIFSFEGILQNMVTSGSRNNGLISNSGLPETQLDKKELRQALVEAIDALSERERLVVSLYYFEHMKLSSIAKIMDVSDQRVSQINTRAILKLKQKLEKYDIGE